MSSKILNKKSDNKKNEDEDKEEQQAIKEVEIVAELAPNEKTRKEAEELIETVENGSTTTLQEAKETISINPQSNSIAQDSSEIFDTCKQGVLKLTEAISKFQPQYSEAISKLQQEYIQLTKELLNKLFAAQRIWTGSNVTATNTTFLNPTYTQYAEQFRRQSVEINAQALSVFNTSNHLALNALNAARENLKLYGKAIDAMMEFNNNTANAWSVFLASAQRQQYFRQ
ncbi:MAG: hypothetical protein ACHQ1D_12640 [Nitrososphaerales archaeon]